jgi:hypothetical protein
MNKMKNLRFEVQDPRSKFQGPRFNIQIARSQTNKTEDRDARSQIPTPRSKIQDPTPRS